MVQLTVLEPLEEARLPDPVREKITAMAGHHQPQLLGHCRHPAAAVGPAQQDGLRSGQRLHRFFPQGDGRLHVSGLSSEDAGRLQLRGQQLGPSHTERLVS